jgi:hypothetical protein
MTTTDLSPAMRDLAEAGQNYAALQRARDKALAELQDKIRAADQEGNKRADIIRAAGVARQTVYDALREPDPGVGA